MYTYIFFTICIYTYNFLYILFDVEKYCNWQSHFGRSSCITWVVWETTFVRRTRELNFPVVLRENDNPESLSTPIRVAVDIVALVSEATLDERYGVIMLETNRTSRTLYVAHYFRWLVKPWKYFLSVLSRCSPRGDRSAESMSFHE